MSRNLNNWRQDGCTLADFRNLNQTKLTISGNFGGFSAEQMTLFLCVILFEKPELPHLKKWFSQLLFKTKSFTRKVWWLRCLVILRCFCWTSSTVMRRTESQKLHLRNNDIGIISNATSLVVFLQQRRHSTTQGLCLYMTTSFVLNTISHRRFQRKWDHFIRNFMFNHFCNVIRDKFKKKNVLLILLVTPVVFRLWVKINLIKITAVKKVYSWRILKELKNSHW